MSPMAPSLSASLMEPSSMILKSSFFFFAAIFFGPIREVGDEFMVGDDEDLVHAFDGGEVVDDVFEHGFAADVQKRFGLGQGERIESGGVTRREDEGLHRKVDLTASDAGKQAMLGVRDWAWETGRA